MSKYIKFEQPKEIIPTNNYYFKEMEKFKHNSTDLVHYSLTGRGNALYFQKIIITKIFRMSLRPSSLLYGGSYNDGIKYLELGGDFQYKYGLITNLQQIKRGISSIMFANDSFSYGSFKNYFYNSTKKGSDAFIKKDMELKTTPAVRLRQFWFLEGLGSHTLFLDIRVLSAKRAMEMKSCFNFSVFRRNWLFDSSISTERIKEKLLKTITNLNTFIRSYYFKSILNLNNFKEPFSFIDFEGFYQKSIAKTHRYRWAFAAENRLAFFTAIGYWNMKSVDMSKDLKINERGGIHKKYVKRYKRWRMGLVHWGKKMFKFKKNYQFWKYARGLTNYFYRGYKINSMFNFRADVFIMKNFGIRNLRFARILVSSGHIFKGSYALRNPRSRVFKYNIMSLSRKANMYINKKRYFKYWNNRVTESDKKIYSKLTKMSPLTYCRQQKNSIFRGEIYNVKYYMFYASELAMLNVESKKTRYFALNYFYAQKLISSAWW